MVGSNSVDKNFFDLDHAITNLINGIRQYESSTFSAREVGGIDRGTARMMAAWLIHTHLFDPTGVPGEAIDGAVIGLAYESTLEAWAAANTQE